MDLSKIIQERQESLEKQIEYMRKSVADSIAKIERTVVFMQEATGEGLMLKVTHDLSCPTWEVPLENGEDWRTLHKLLGEFENYSIEAISNDARKKDVWVYMKPKNKEFS